MKNYYYRVVTQETKKPTVENEEEVIRKISKMFASTVTKDGFENLILLLDWSWTAFKKMIYEKVNFIYFLESRI